MGIWYLLTPVLYPMSAVPEAWRTWMLLNPMAAIVNAFKYGLLRVGDPHLAEFAISAMIVFALLAVAIRYFADRDAAVMDAR
jgi:lipopolysaccharide transport system permease protein